MVATAGTGPSAVALLGGAALMALAFSAGRFSATDLTAATGLDSPVSGSIATVIAQPLRPPVVMDAPGRRAGRAAGGAFPSNRSLVLPDAGCTVDLFVMFRTRSSANTVEEVVAFYLAQGARFVLVIDNSPDDAVENLLRPYVRGRRVIYERDHYFDQTQASETTKAREGGNLRDHALTFARLAAVSPRPAWLLSVDDDEFVVPAVQETNFAKLIALLSTAAPGLAQAGPATTSDAALEQSTRFHANQSLCRHLSDPETLRWKSLLFRWKWVGSSGLTEVPAGALYSEAFAKMGAKVDQQGKSAFHLNHPDVTLQTWIDQDNLLVTQQKRERYGGPYFMHGNNPLLTLRAAADPAPKFKGGVTFPAVVGNRSYTRGPFDVKNDGFCFHFMGTPARFDDHYGLWDGYAGRGHDAVAREIDKRDQNNITWDAVSQWSCRVRLVMDLVRGESAAGRTSGGGGGTAAAGQTAPRPGSHRCIR